MRSNADGRRPSDFTSNCQLDLVPIEPMVEDARFYQQPALDVHCG